MDLDTLRVSSGALVISADPCADSLVHVRPRDILAGFVGHDTGIPVVPFLRSVVGKRPVNAELPPATPNEDQGAKVTNPVCTGQTAILYCSRRAYAPIVRYCHIYSRTAILGPKGPRWKRGETPPRE
jgi:hypothetical protein